SCVRFTASRCAAAHRHLSCRRPTGGGARFGHSRLDLRTAGLRGRNARHAESHAVSAPRRGTDARAGAAVSGADHGAHGRAHRLRQSGHLARHRRAGLCLPHRRGGHRHLRASAAAQGGGPVSVLAALALSVLGYVAGVWLQRRTGSKPYMQPILLGMFVVVAVLALLDAPATEDYLAHNGLLLDLLMVAVVAFAIPLVDNVRVVLRDLIGLAFVVLAAGAFIASSTLALCYVAGIDAASIAAFSLRSVTNPIAIAVAEQNAISVDLAMLGVFITG